MWPDLSTRGPYSALLRVGLAVPVLLPGPRWALTPPFHPHRGSGPASLAGEARPPRQTLLCGAFPGVAPAGRYPAPFLHGVRTFLETKAPRSSSPPREPGHTREAAADQALTGAAARSGQTGTRSRGDGGGSLRRGYLDQSERQARQRSAGQRCARSAASARSVASSGPRAQGRKRRRKAASRMSGGASG